MLNNINTTLSFIVLEIIEIAPETNKLGTFACF